MNNGVDLLNKTHKGSYSLDPPLISTNAFVFIHKEVDLC